MTDGLAAAQARIAQLRSLVDPAATQRQASSAATSKSAAGFEGALAQALGVGPDASTTATAPAAGDQAVSIARKYLGTPYRWGGTDPKTGLDCSGLTKVVYQQLGVDLPRVSRDQAKVGTKVDSIEDARPGDLVFFDEPVDHVGIYAGNGKMVEAPHTGAKVRVHDVWEKPTHIRRVLPTADGGLSPGSGVAGIAGRGPMRATMGRGPQSPGGIALGTPYADLFSRAGRKHGVDPALLAAIAKAESSFNPRAVSRAGAQGLMQLMPGTARDLGVNALIPAEAVDGAARLMSRHLRAFGGRVDLALAAYNAGPGNVRKYGGVPPFEETQNYVQRVTRNWGDLR
jgi:cell wall-associated NlpC family hydrolase